MDIEQTDKILGIKMALYIIIMIVCILLEFHDDGLAVYTEGTHDFFCKNRDIKAN